MTCVVLTCYASCYTCSAACTEHSMAVALQHTRAAYICTYVHMSRCVCILKHFLWTCCVFVHACTPGISNWVCMHEKGGPNSLREHTACIHGTVCLGSSTCSPFSQVWNNAFGYTVFIRNQRNRKYAELRELATILF